MTCFCASEIDWTAGQLTIGEFRVTDRLSHLQARCNQSRKHMLLKLFWLWAHAFKEKKGRKNSNRQFWFHGDFKHVMWHDISGEQNKLLSAAVTWMHTKLRLVVKNQCSGPAVSGGLQAPPQWENQKEMACVTKQQLEPRQKCYFQPLRSTSEIFKHLLHNLWLFLQVVFIGV